MPLYFFFGLYWILQEEFLDSLFLFVNTLEFGIYIYIYIHFSINFSKENENFN